MLATACRVRTASAGVWEHTIMAGVDNNEQVLLEFRKASPYTLDRTARNCKVLDMKDESVW